MTIPVTAFLGLGSNLGDRLGTLQAAVYALDDVEGVVVEDVSGIYETAPWPPPGDPRAVPQDPYLDAVVRVRTTLTPRRLLEECQVIEIGFGRDRATEERWGPRPLDLDLLLYDDLEVHEPDLEVPHPRLTERAFVLIPLVEVFPGGALPDGRRLTQLVPALAPIEGIELVVRLDEVPGRHVPRPEGPRSAGAFLAEEWTPSRQADARRETERGT